MRGYVSLHQKEDTSGCTREASRESHDEKSQPPIVLRGDKPVEWNVSSSTPTPREESGSPTLLARVLI